MRRRPTSAASFTKWTRRARKRRRGSGAGWRRQRWRVNRLFVVRHSPIHGTGVFAARDIAAEEEIVEYAGRRITREQADAEYPGDDGHTFLYELNDQYLIDAAVDGNDSRWINHSCDPNCDVWLIESDDGNPAHDRLVIQAMRPIRAGEELTYDYGIPAGEPMTDALRALWACKCGAPNCRGVMLEPDAG